MSLLSLVGISDALAATGTAAAPHAQGSIWQMMWLPLLIILVFYFLVFRPQSKRAKEQRNMLNKVSVGDEVMTAGGMVGKVVRLKDNFVVLKIAKEVEVTFQKSSVASVLPKGTVASAD
jgi:preprotein translocase subunit YajC